MKWFSFATGKTIWKSICVSAVALSTLACSSDCFGHFPFRYAGYRAWNGFHGGFHGGFSYARFYRPRVFFPTYSVWNVRVAPVYHVRSVHYRPAYVNPWCYTPVYCPPSTIYYSNPAPVYYSVPVYSPPVYTVPVYDPLCNATSPARGSSFTTPTVATSSVATSSVASTSSWNRPVSLQPASSIIPRSNRGMLAHAEWEEAVYGDSLNDASESTGVRLVSYRSDRTSNEANEVVRSKPAVKSVVSSQSIETSNRLIDAMVAGGDMRNALRSCESIEQSRQSMGSSTQLRFAILTLFTPETETTTDRVLHLLNFAAASGSKLDASELQGMRLADYLKPAQIDLKDTLDAFSKNALRDSQDTVKDILLIAALLRLNGETERSKLFAQEVFNRAIDYQDFEWHSLLAQLQR